MKKIISEIDRIKEIMGTSILSEGRGIDFLLPHKNIASSKLSKEVPTGRSVMSDDAVSRLGMFDDANNVITTRAKLEAEYNNKISKDIKTTEDYDFIKKVHEKVLDTKDLKDIAKSVKDVKENIGDNFKANRQFDEEMTKLFNDTQYDTIFDEVTRLKGEETKNAGTPKEPKGFYKFWKEIALPTLSTSVVKWGLIIGGSGIIATSLVYALKEFSKPLADFAKEIWGFSGFGKITGPQLFAKIIDANALPGKTSQEIANAFGFKVDDYKTYATKLYSYESWVDVTESELSSWVSDFSSKYSGLELIVLSKVFSETYGKTIYSFLVSEGYDKETMGRIIKTSCSDGFKLFKNFDVDIMQRSVDGIINNYYKILEDIKTGFYVKVGTTNNFELIKIGTVLNGEAVTDADIARMKEEALTYFEKDYMTVWVNKELEKAMEKKEDSSQKLLDKIQSGAKDIKQDIKQSIETVLPIYLDVKDAEQSIVNKMQVDNFLFGGSEIITLETLKSSLIKIEPSTPEPTKTVTPQPVVPKPVVPKPKPTPVPFVPIEDSIINKVGLAKLLTEQTNKKDWFMTLFQETMNTNQPGWYNGKNILNTDANYGVRDAQTNAKFAESVGNKSYTSSRKESISKYFVPDYGQLFRFITKTGNKIRIISANDATIPEFEGSLNQFPTNLIVAFYCGVMSVPEYKNQIVEVQVSDDVANILKNNQTDINKYLQ
jgi:hypothetical protein